jgi:hypothetical protein
MASSCLFGTIDSSYVFSTNVWISSARKKDFHRSPAQVLDVCESVVAVALASCEKPVRRFGFSWISCRAQSPRGLSVRAAFTGMWDAILPSHHVYGSPRWCLRDLDFLDTPRDLQPVRALRSYGARKSNLQETGFEGVRSRIVIACVTWTEKLMAYVHSKLFNSRSASTCTNRYNKTLWLRHLTVWKSARES